MISLSKTIYHFDLTECQDILKERYHITSVMYMTSSIDASLRIENVNSYSIAAYNPTMRERLDLSICEHTYQQVSIPIVSRSEVNLTLFKEMEKYGIDIFNSTDPTFTSRCNAFKDNDKDTTVNYRINNIYQKRIPMCIGFNCSYQGINEFDYVKCNCTGLRTKVEIINGIVNSVISTFSEVNLGIVLCYNRILTVSYFIIYSLMWSAILGCM
jgi:hypothetical protein